MFTCVCEGGRFFSFMSFLVYRRCFLTNTFECTYTHHLFLTTYGDLAW